MALSKKDIKFFEDEEKEAENSFLGWYQEANQAMLKNRFLPSESLKTKTNL